MVEMDPIKYFLPNRKSKHRVPMTYSKTNPEQRATKRKKGAAGSSISKKKKTTQPKDVVSRRKAGMTANSKQNKSTDESNSDYQDDDVDRVPANEQKRKLHSNPPVLIRMSGIIMKCTGCEEYFDDKYRKPPHDIIFKFMMCRKQPVGNGKWVMNNYKLPAYFHTQNLGCLHAIDELAEVEIDDIYLGNETYFSLTKEHIELMKKKKF